MADFEILIEDNMIYILQRKMLIHDFFCYAYI